MQHPLRVIAALAALFALVAVPVWAGTQTAPEVTDASYDVKSSPGGLALCNSTAATCAAGMGIDFSAGWVNNETASSIIFFLTTTKGAGTSSSSVYTYHFHFKSGGTDYDAFATLQPKASGSAPQLGTGALTPGGVAANASLDANGVIAMTVPRSAIGSPAAGATITDMYVETFGNPQGKVAEIFTDRGPDTGTSTMTYTFTEGAGNATGTAGDSDGDLLNDTWEQSHFGNLNQTATGDPDKDGCNNACEEKAKTDPNKADTDGDGCSDGDEIKAGTDPTDKTKKPSDCAAVTNATSSGSGGPGSTTSGSLTSGSTSSSGTSSDNANGAVDNGDSTQRLKEGFEKGAFGFGYLILASALAGVVIILALIGRGGRWGL